MNSKRAYVLMWGVILFLACQKTAVIQRSNLPTSHEATLLEVYSPAEVMITASGIGVDEEAAVLDARRSAVYFVLAGGTDHLLQTLEEREKFKLIEQEFFERRNVTRFISWEGEEYLRRIRLTTGKLKIEKEFRVNKELIKQELISQGILPAEPALAESLGLPFIMVLPKTVGEESPIELLNQDPNLEKAAQVIESFLTARRYDVLVPEQKFKIDNDIRRLMKGVQQDYSYFIALLVGSDIYITYTLDIESRYIGNSEVKKALVGVRAFETTTSRLLGTETGYSSERLTSDAVIIEEAISDAVDNVLNRITAYWKDDLARGIQLKIIMNIGRGFSEQERYLITSETVEILKELTNRVKENIVGETTLDYLVWVDPNEATSASEFFRSLRREYSLRLRNYKLKDLLINRKLLLLKIEKI